jgi:hypothetical protein
MNTEIETSERKPIGATVDIDLWNEIKIQAIREKRKTGEILDDAIRMYLKTKTRDDAV